MADVEIRADDFLKLSKALKAAGRTGKGSLRSELHSGMRAAAKPSIKEAQRVLGAALPGPLAAKGRATKQQAKVSTGRDPGLRITVSYGPAGKGLSASNARRLNNQGVIRHPVYADAANKTRKQWKWVNQPASNARGWFDDTHTKNAREVRHEAEQAMERVANKVVAGVR